MGSERVSSRSSQDWQPHENSREIVNPGETPSAWLPLSTQIGFHIPSLQIMDTRTHTGWRGPALLWDILTSHHYISLTKFTPSKAPFKPTLGIFIFHPGLKAGLQDLWSDKLAGWAEDEDGQNIFSPVFTAACEERCGFASCQHRCFGWGSVSKNKARRHLGVKAITEASVPAVTLHQVRFPQRHCFITHKALESLG